MATRVIPGSGAEFRPVFNEEYGVESFIVTNGGSGYISTDPPKIEIIGTQRPLDEGIFYPIISSGEITQIAVLKSGSGYFPITSSQDTKIGIVTTEYVESSLRITKYDENNSPYISVASSESHVVMHVTPGRGSAIFENGYNVAISTTVTGLTAPITPNYSGNQNRFWGFFEPFPSYKTNGIGTGAKFNAFIVYDSFNGNAISTSIILREGGNRYSVGDNVSISGTYIGGNTPANDLTFTVSNVTNTRIGADANLTYVGVPGTTLSGVGTGVVFNIRRDGFGDIDSIDVVNGGSGYALTTIIGVSGTYIGGSTPADDLKINPEVLGADTLPPVAYIQKTDDNGFRVTGLTTTEQLNLRTYGSGTHSFNFDNPNASSIILIDNIVQAPLYRRDLKKTLVLPVGVNTTTIYLSGISSLTTLDTIQIDSEYFDIKDVGLTSPNSVEVVRGTLGSQVGYHTVGAAVTILRGDYNIVKDEINFKSAPFGPIGLDQLKINSSFNGRIFSRQVDYGFNPNDRNVIFDDISTKFVGASSTEFFLESNQQPIVGVYTDTSAVLIGGVDVNNNPLVFINNIPQISETDFTVDNDALQIEKGNRIKFLSGTPGAGKISRTIITGGFGYQPLIGAGATAIISGLGTISSIDLEQPGSGYRNPPQIKVISQVGSGASLVANVGTGGTITSIDIVSGGSGYTTTIPVILEIDEPPYFSDLDLEYVPGVSSGEGTGAKASVVIGNRGDIIGFDMEEPGIYYKPGDILYIPDLIKSTGISTVNVTALSYDNTTGITTILTDSPHGLLPDDYVKLSGIAMTCDSWTGFSTFTVTSFKYNEDVGICTITTEIPHGLPTGDYFQIEGINLICTSDYTGITSTVFPYPAGINTFGDPYPQSSPNTLGGTYNVFRSITGTSGTTIVFDAGISTITHNYESGKLIQQITPTDATYDPASGEFVITSIGHTVTTNNRINIELESFVFTCTMDGNATEHYLPESDQYAAGRLLQVSGVTTDTITVNVGSSGQNQYFTPSDATYNTLNGDLVLTIGEHTLSTGEGIKIVPNSLSFTCTMDGNDSIKSYPRVGIDPYASRSIPIKATTDTTITLNVGAAGSNKYFTPTNATYDPVGGALTVTVGQHGLGVGRNIVLEDNSFTFTCDLNGNSTEHTYPRPGIDTYSGKSIEIISVGFTSYTATDAPYDALNGIVTIEIVNHGFNEGDYVKIADNSLRYSCELDEHSQWKYYPRPNYDYASGRWLKISNVTTNTFDINIGKSSYTGIHTFISATANGVARQDGTFTINVGSAGTNTSTHTFVSATQNAIKYEPQSDYTFVSAATSAIQHLPQSTHSFVRTSNNSISVYDYNGTVTIGITSSIFPYPGASYNTVGDTYDVFTALEGTSGSTLVLNTGISTIAHTYDYGGTVTNSPFIDFNVIVDEIITDKFNGFYPGQFIQFDDISPFFNGRKRKFTLTVTEGNETDVLSLITKKESDLRMENNLFVFVNDILQEPIYSYTWNGSRIIFKEAPLENSKCTILFFRGSDLDVEQVDPPETIKQGDTVQIGENILDQLDRPQFERIVKRIVSTDTLDTFSYNSLGINTDPTKERPLRWKKQTQDRIINGVLYSKARPSLRSRVKPSTKIIKNIDLDDTEIYVNNVFPLFSEVDLLPENIRNIRIVDVDTISPALCTATVSSASTISDLNLVDGGTGYNKLENPQVSISSAFIQSKDPIYNWVGTAITGISSNFDLTSIVIGDPIVSVGSSGVLGITTNGIDWMEDNIGYGQTISFNGIAFAEPNNFIAAGEYGKIVYSNFIGTTFNSWNELIKIKESTVIGSPVPILTSSTYSDTFNDIMYSPYKDIWIAIGNNRGLFVASGVGATSIFEKSPPSFGNLNSIAENSNIIVAVGDGGNIIYSDNGNIWQRSLSVPSTRKLNDIIWTGNTFVVVGNNGTILTSDTGFDVWRRVSQNIVVDFIKIRYEYGLFVALSSTGTLYFSNDLEYWLERDTNQSNQPKDLKFIPPPPPPELRLPGVEIISDEGRYVLVGTSGTTMYAEPIYNRATGVSTVVNGSVSSLTITNAGFGYRQNPLPPVLIQGDSPLSEEIYSIKVVGDHGLIRNISVGNSFIDFELESEFYDNSTLGIGYSSLNVYGVNFSEIQVGDYFIISESNTLVGQALTGITTYLGGLNNYPESKVGTASSYLDGVYRAERVSQPPGGVGIVTVRCMFAYGSDYSEQPIQAFVNTNTNQNGIYGRYSWGKIYDYQNRRRFSPKEFIVNTDNGLVGLSTAPDVYRTRAVK